MYCKNCGKNLNQVEIFCSNCGEKVEIKVPNNSFADNKKHITVTDKTEIISRISFIMFVVIMIANIVFYPLSLTDDESSGMFWFFLILLPSIPLFFVSLVLSIISIKSFFSKKTQYTNTTKSKKVFACLNVIQIILMIIIIMFVFKYLTS